MPQFQLLTKPDANAKTKKNLAHGVMTFGLHLAPADLSGFEVCAGRTDGCTAGCLNTAGYAAMHLHGVAIQAARIGRTRLYFEQRDTFMIALSTDILRAQNYADKRGCKLSIRLNCTSDIPWHRVPFGSYPSIIEAFPAVQFYDYTKIAKRLLKETLPVNYHLTFSLAENNGLNAVNVLRAGRQVAIVFRDKATVQQVIAGGYYTVEDSFCAPVVDGDQHDLRYLDPANCVVALYAKGKTKQDQSGFVRDL